MTKILFSPIGMTDPLRDEHDGPMIHIIRHYQPDKVYFFLTGEMEEIEDKDHRFTKAVEKLGFTCQVELIKTGISDPSDFDAFMRIMPEELDKIAKENPGARIYANVTSGTPQIMSALCLLIASGRYNITPVQVKTHKGRSNMEKSRQNFNLDEHIAKLKDNEPGEMISRCHQPPIVNFKKSLLASQIKSLINQYDYSAVLTLIQPHKALFDKFTELNKLVEFASHRINLKRDEALQFISENEVNYALLYFGDDVASQIIEYFQTMKIKQFRGELTDFILRITPLIAKVLQIFIGRYFTLKDIVCMDGKTEKISREKINRHYPVLLNEIDNHFQKGFRDHFVNTRSLTAILSGLEGSGMIKFEFPKDKNDFNCIKKFFNFFCNLEQDFRNTTAHQMIIITEKDLVKLGNKMTSKEILKKLQQLLCLVFKNDKDRITSLIYDHINKLIIERLE